MNSVRTHSACRFLPPFRSTAAVDLLRRMQGQRAAIQRRISHAQEGAAATAATFSAALLSARSVANQTVSNRAQLNDLKQQLRKLEADLAQALFDCWSPLRLNVFALTYRHELGKNYNFIRPNLIVGFCLQSPLDVDKLRKIGVKERCKNSFI